MRPGAGRKPFPRASPRQQRGDTLDRPTTGFRPLLLLRLLTVVNDNLLRWLVIGLGKRAAGEAGTALVLTIGTAGFVLPFIVLAWLAGWLADRFPKRSVLVWCKAAEIAIVAAAAAAVAWGAGAGGQIAGLPAGLWLLLAALVTIGSQAAILAPAMLGTIPETVPQEKLASANGVFALVTLAATLAGMAGGNWLADVTPLAAGGSAAVPLPAWITRLPFGHAAPTAGALVAVAVVGWLAALRLPRVAAADPHAALPWNALARSWHDLAELFANRKLAAAAAGIVFFWAMGAVAQLNIDQFAAESGSTSQGQVVPLLVALIVGIGLGSLLAGRLATHGIDAGSRVDLGFVPVGGLVMAVACFALAASSTTIFGAGVSGWRLAGPAFWLAVLGIGAGILDVPLEAYLQEQSPPARRGAILASTNLLVFAGMFAASLAYGGLRTPVGAADALRPLVSARGVFAIFGILSATVAAAAVYAAPRASLRLVVASLVHTIWRFRTVDAERVPAAGPVTLVANHLSWLDGFLLPMATPRPVRMVVYGPNIQGSFLRMLADQWRFILFDPRPKSIGTALKTIQGGLADGDAVGIFCEGGISRTGQLLGFKRGLEWLLEKVESPLQPVSIDGLWGGGLTFSEGRYFTKWPRLWRRTITLTYGPPLPAGTHPDQARLALQEVTAGAVRRRMTERCRGGQAGAGNAAAWRATAEAFDGCCLVRREDRMLASLAAGDPLFASLGTHGGRLLGIRQTVIDAATPAAEIVARLGAEKSSLWLARIEQVAAAAAITTPPALPALEVVVLPIGSAADLPRARAASDAFHAAFGIAPVVAYAPPEAGGLVAMNTPAKRVAWSHETIDKPDTVGRVVNGVVVWPHAADREPLGLEPLDSQGIGSGELRTLVIGATLPWPVGGCKTSAPRAALMTDTFDVDKDGFLVLRS